MKEILERFLGVSQKCCEAFPSISGEVLKITMKYQNNSVKKCSEEFLEESLDFLFNKSMTVHT